MFCFIGSALSSSICLSLFHSFIFYKYGLVSMGVSQIFPPKIRLTCINFPSLGSGAEFMCGQSPEVFSLFWEYFSTLVLWICHHVLHFSISWLLVSYTHKLLLLEPSIFIMSIVAPMQTWQWHHWRKRTLVYFSHNENTCFSPTYIRAGTAPFAAQKSFIRKNRSF